MAFRSFRRKRASRIPWLLLFLVILSACGGSSQPPVDLDAEPAGTSRDQLRTAMAQERPIFFETIQGERFYGEVRSTYDDRFLLKSKDAFEGERIIPMSDRMQYDYAEILCAELIPEEGNSTRGFVLGTTVLVLAIFAVVALFASLPLQSG